MEYRILGPLEVLHDGRPIPVAGDRQRALLAILILRANEVVSADRLMEDLWDDQPPEGGLNALQAAVSRLRRSLRRTAEGSPISALATQAPGYVLRADADAIDAIRFERLAAVGHRALTVGDHDTASSTLNRALALWRGPVLSDFGHREFAQGEITRLEEVHRRAVEDRLEADLERGCHMEVLGELKALVSTQPLNERLRRQLMLALYRAGRHVEALSVYREGWRLLFDELGVEPGPELQETEAAILRNDPALVGPTTSPGSRAGALDNLIVQRSSFVGREREVAEIRSLLADRRLVTLVGPGGSGKSRLALEVARQIKDEFPHGVWHVDLSAVGSTRYLVHAIAGALHFPIDHYTSDVGARGQLLDFLERRSLLLVLDNFEHLVSGAHLLVELVARARDARVLVTSRERLDLRDEWAVEVDGLPHTPPGLGSAEPAALQLFRARAAQAESRLAASDVDREAALRICSMVEGMPLAIELAAAWSPILSCAEIASEIERSVDFLISTMRDVPEEHRSMRAAFDHSWNLLTPNEQAGLARLSAFSGGFLRAAAAQVAGVELPLLSALVAKSLLHAEVDGRYRMHELIRQYAAERLAANPDEQHRVSQRHAVHYVGLLMDRERDFVGQQALEARVELRPDLGNLRTAVLHAASEWEDHRSVTVIRALLSFYRAHGLHEGMDAFREVAEALEQRGATLSDETPRRNPLVAAIVAAAFCETICGVVTAESSLLRCLPTLRSDAALRRELGVALMCLGIGVEFRGEYRRAVTYLEGALEILRGVGDEALVWPCLLWLGWARLDLGHVRRAAAIFREAHEIATRTGDLLGIAYALSKLGIVADARGAYSEGKRYHSAALDAFARLGDRTGPAYAISRMSLSAWGMADHLEAERLGREGLELFSDVGHGWGVATSYCRIGFAELAQGKMGDAVASLSCGLQHGLEHGLESVALSALVGLGIVLARGPEPSRGAEVLAFTLRHPTTPAHYRPIARGELDRIADRSPEVPTVSGRRAAAGDVRRVAATVRNHLAAEDVGRSSGVTSGRR